MFSAMSYGSISKNAHESLAIAASKLEIHTIIPAKAVCTKIFTNMVKHTIVQVASGRFGVHQALFGGRRRN